MNPKNHIELKRPFSFLHEANHASSSFGRWIYIHSMVNLLGIIAFFFSWMFPIWLGLLSFSFLFFIRDVKRSSELKTFPIGFGYPNLITTGRLVLLVSLAFVFQYLSDWVLFISFSILILLDGLDGLVARRLGQTSAQGERLDAEVDAQLVWLLSWIHFYSGNAEWWILIAGSLRYTYQLLFFWIPAVSSFPPKRFRATVAVFFFFSLSFTFILPGYLATYVLLGSSTLIIISFGLSLIGGIKHLRKRKTQG